MHTDWQALSADPPTATFDVDQLIDIANRNAQPLPELADRVVAADMDNDGRTDAIVQLFGIGFPIKPLTTANGFNLPLSRYSVGWRYLRNRMGDVGWQPGQAWFEDVAATRFRDAGTNAFSPLWNRHLGSLQIADFDNNGRLDVFTTFGVLGKVGDLVTDIGQTTDLLFLNESSGTAGTLTNRSVTHLPLGGQVPPIVTANFNNSALDYPGAPGSAVGDIDNDGDADVLVFRGNALVATAFPSLLVNDGAGVFVDGYLQRVRPQLFNQTLLHSAEVGTPIANYPVGTTSTMILDRASMGAIGDLDGDGDQDIVWQVDFDTLRVLRNDGEDTNNDGLINSADPVVTGLGLGHFTDVSTTWIAGGLALASPQATDFALVDMDADGDLDVVVNQYQSPITLWRNTSANPLQRPRVAEVWPRVGSLRGQQISLRGANLDQVTQVVFRVGANEYTGTNIIPVSPTELKVTIPTSCRRGLAQIRVARTVSGTTVWSTQYKGYFIQV